MRSPSVDEEGVEEGGRGRLVHTRKIWRGRVETIRRGEAERWIWPWRRGGEREGHADGSFMQGAIVNQSRGSVSRVCGPGVTTGRAGMIEGEEREGGIGTINIVFATILGTSAERPAL